MGTPEERMAKISARASAALVGPWHTGGYSRRDGRETQNVWGPRAKPEHQSGPVVALDCRAHGDAEFIAHARSDIPWLLDEIACYKKNLMMVEASEAARMEHIAELQAELATERLSRERAERAAFEAGVKWMADLTSHGTPKALLARTLDKRFPSPVPIQSSPETPSGSSPSPTPVKPLVCGACGFESLFPSIMEFHCDNTGHCMGFSPIVPTTEPDT